MKGRFGLALAAVLVAGACSDALEQNTTVGQVVAVVTFDGFALTLVSVNDFTTNVIPSVLGDHPRIVGRGSTLLVTSEASSELTVIDLSQRPLNFTPGASPLPSPSGAVIQDDSIAWVVFSDQLARLNYRTGDMRTVTVGSVNTDVALTAGRVFVLAGNRTGKPLPPSYIRVVNPTTVTAEDSIPLSGTGASHMTVGDDSLLYVVDTGLLSDSAGKLSIVDPVARAEVVIINGLGAGAGQAVFHPSGRLLIASVVKGILEVNTLTRTLSRGPGNAIVTGGQAITGLAIDQAGRVFAVDADLCAVTVLTPPPDYRKTRTPVVGSCGYSAAAATLP